MLHRLRTACLLATSAAISAYWAGSMPCSCTRRAAKIDSWLEYFRSEGIEAISYGDVDGVVVSGWADGGLTDEATARFQAALGSCLGIALVGQKFLESTARQPEMIDALQTKFFLVAGVIVWLIRAPPDLRRFRGGVPTLPLPEVSRHSE